MKSAEHPVKPSIAVGIPCYQEALTIGKVVADFRRELPEAAIYVYDNNCTDGTAEIAAAAGAIVRREKRQGKGFVVAAMFDDLVEDILVMVDGDDTYEASHVHRLLEPVRSGEADMSVARRLTNSGPDSFRPLHVAGNKLVCAIINRVFRSDVSDIFSGYRAFTRECAKQIPITSKGFDIETEMTLQALYRGQVIREVPAAYRARPDGSFSKLKTYSDGSRVLLRLFLILKSYKPLTLFGGASMLLVAAAAFAGLGPIYQMITHPDQFAREIPAVLLAISLIMMALLSLGIGLILNSINLRLLELERIALRSGIASLAAGRREETRKET